MAWLSPSSLVDFGKLSGLTTASDMVFQPD